MTKKNRLSKDQRRKAKLSKESKAQQAWNPLAYKGNKYKKDEFAAFFYVTESAIYEAWSLSDFQLTDHTVIAALGILVEQLRQGPLPPYDASTAPQAELADHKSLIVQEIRKSWEELRAKGTLPDRDTLVGVLRTILGSIDVWGSPGANSTGYLTYLKGFLGKIAKKPPGILGRLFG